MRKQLSKPQQLCRLAQCLHRLHHLCNPRSKDTPMPAATTDPHQAALHKYISASPTLQALQAHLPGLLPPLFPAALAALAGQWQSKPFLRIQPVPKADEWLWSAGLIWNAACSGEAHTPETGAEKLKTWGATGKKPWRLPTQPELVNFVKTNNCPWFKTMFESWYVLSDTHAFHLSNSGGVNSHHSQGKLLAVTESFQGDVTALLLHAYLHDWSVFAVGDASNTDLLKPLKSGTAVNLSAAFRAIDHRSARLPHLESADFTDPNKGLWELWGLDAAGLEAVGLRARNPADDVQQGMVAIDFGTSSTVVAFEKNGIGELLRIGVTDFWETPKPAHYENPTVLELVDFAALLKPWRTEAYRPAVSWDDVRCSHEALHNFRNNDTKPEVVASVLTKIKQWALREGDGTRVRLTDRKEGKRIEHELAPLTLRLPVKGQALTVSESDPFDPVELYAWFLGLTINWRKRGIFLRYYMSFPVDYPREVKEKILASFRRGLQRSLPATLVAQPVFEQFVVEERASEPAAYAAIALQCLGIAPTAEGVAYAVFDFGGGTTDFDFGYYRLPTDTEERAGIEQVFEHFGNGGDKFLGGENLLEHLAYLTFRHNLEVCRAKKVAFTRPLDALDFNGSEMFLERTQAAATNTLMLVSRLRSYWESGEEGKSDGVERINLIDRDVKSVPCEFTLPYPELKAFLETRIEQGVHNFFTALKKAFGTNLPAQVQVLLAGNASRSTMVLGLFGLLPDEHAQTALKERTTAFLATLFEGRSPEFTAHAPLAADEQDTNRPTAKTGVALGLLELCPGSATKVVNHAVKNVTGDAPFQHYVGRIRQKKFHVSLHQGGVYQQWVELGPVSEDRVFNLYHSQAALAHSGQMALGDPALFLKRQMFAGDTSRHQAFARPIKPHEIEVCTALSLEAAGRGEFENLRVLKLG